jgi:metal-dependent amidase/aminoacylase/carboxypeptidase family protein
VDVASRRIMQDELRRLAESIGTAYGVTAQVTFHDGTPPLVNGAEPAGFAREAATRTVGAEGVVPLGTVNLAAEDFAFYLEKMPGCFMRIGAREPAGEFVAAHSPHFHAAEESIAVGAAVLAECARISAQRLGA